MQVFPLRDNVLVERLEADDRSKGGILIPDTAKERPCKARVIAVGPGEYDKDLGKWREVAVGPGETVLFNRRAGEEVEVDGKTLLLLPEKAVIARFAE